MEHLNEQNLRLINKVEKLIKAIDNSADWFIASIQEKDPKRKALARFMSEEKEKVVKQLAKEVYESK